VLTLGVRIFDHGQQESCIKQVALFVPRISLIGGCLEDHRTERGRNADRSRASRNDLKPSVDGPFEGLSAALDRNHGATAKLLDHAGCRVVGHQYVDDVRCAGDEVDGGLAALEPVGGVVAFVDGRREFVPERLKRAGVSAATPRVVST